MSARRVRDVALLGVGAVGSAFFSRLREREDAALRVAYVASSRHAVRHDASEVRRDAPLEHELAPGTIVVDATASDAIAARHVEWLSQGSIVVTANKRATSGSHAQWLAILRASDAHARYGDSATVGAGLPFLRTVRDAVAGGDTVTSIAAVLSGSLAYLFDGYDGREPFGARVEAARARGYTEPDPRVDLAGEDVRRKLVILARAAGRVVEPEEVAVESLCATGTPADFAAVEHRAREAAATGCVLRYVARLDERGLACALEALRPDDPLATGRGPANRLVLHTRRYAERPLVIEGPGAGAAVTAGALLADVLRLSGVTRAAAVAEAPVAS